MNDHPLPVLVLGDMLAVAADDLAVTLSTPTCRRLAAHMVELLALAGWEVVHAPDVASSVRDFLGDRDTAP